MKNIRLVVSLVLLLYFAFGYQNNVGSGWKARASALVRRFWGYGGRMQDSHRSTPQAIRDGVVRSGRQRHYQSALRDEI